MSARKQSESKLPALRAWAEKALGATRPAIDGMSPEEIMAKIHELEVHQVELQIQNEDLRQAQMELAEARDRLNDLFEFAPVGYLTMDPDGVVLEANLTATTILGVERGALVGQKLDRFIAPDSQDDFYMHRRALFGSDRRQVCELCFYRPDGTNMTARLESVSAENPATRARSYRSALSDVSEQKETRETLQKRNDEMLRFTHAVSHDLKSPLVTIRTFLGFLERDLKAGDAAKAESDMGHLVRATDKMTRLLDEILEFSRVGRKMNPPEDVSLQTLVKEALDFVAGRLTERGVKAKVTDVPIVLHGDRARLVEVFQNLLDNAAKFTGDQLTPQVEIGVEETGEEMVIYIRDNGSGWDPSHGSKLFGLFEKLHPGTEGTGVGLALVKRIVEVHGGRIWAESAGPDQGATFRFTLANTRRSKGEKS